MKKKTFKKWEINKEKKIILVPGRLLLGKDKSYLLKQ